MPSVGMETDIQIKASNGQVSVNEAQGIVECFVAAIGNKDSVGDIIQPGAFASSLQRRKPRVVWGHNWNDPIGKVLDIQEVGPSDPRLPEKMKSGGVGGLYARVQFNLESEKGREAFSNVAFFGSDQEWSIGYKTINATFDPVRQANILHEVELYECSPVLHGANQLTGTISVKSADAQVLEHEIMHDEMQDNFEFAFDEKDGLLAMMPVEAPRTEGLSDQHDRKLELELMSRSPQPIKLISATDGVAIFQVQRSDNGPAMYRVHYHYHPDCGFMLGRPERVMPQMIYAPIQPSHKPSTIHMKPQIDPTERYRQNPQDTVMPRIMRVVQKLNNADDQKQEDQLIISCKPEDAFATKSLLDPIIDYHGALAEVTEEGIIIKSGATPDFVKAVETATKALGRRLGRGLLRGGGGGSGKVRRAGRALTTRFNPDARDADLDLIVQEGTPWERPATPGVPDIPTLPSRRRAAFNANRRGGGFASRRADGFERLPDPEPDPDDPRPEGLLPGETRPKTARIRSMSRDEYEAFRRKSMREIIRSRRMEVPPDVLERARYHEYEGAPLPVQDPQFPHPAYTHFDHFDVTEPVQMAFFNDMPVVGRFTRQPLSLEIWRDNETGEWHVNWKQWTPDALGRIGDDDRYPSTPKSMHVIVPKSDFPGTGSLGDDGAVRDHVAGLLPDNYRIGVHDEWAKDENFIVVHVVGRDLPGATADGHVIPALSAAGVDVVEDSKSWPFEDYRDTSGNPRWVEGEASQTFATREEAEAWVASEPTEIYPDFNAARYQFVTGATPLDDRLEALYRYFLANGIERPLDVNYNPETGDVWIDPGTYHELVAAQRAGIGIIPTRLVRSDAINEEAALTDLDILAGGRKRIPAARENFATGDFVTRDGLVIGTELALSSIVESRRGHPVFTHSDEMKRLRMLVLMRGGTGAQQNRRRRRGMSPDDRDGHASRRTRYDLRAREVSPADRLARFERETQRRERGINVAARRGETVVWNDQQQTNRIAERITGLRSRHFTENEIEDILQPPHRTEDLGFASRRHANQSFAHNLREFLVEREKMLEFLDDNPELGVDWEAGTITEDDADLSADWHEARSVADELLEFFKKEHDAWTDRVEKRDEVLERLTKEEAELGEQIDKLLQEAPDTLHAAEVRRLLEAGDFKGFIAHFTPEYVAEREADLPPDVPGRMAPRSIFRRYGIDLAEPSDEYYEDWTNNLSSTWSLATTIQSGVHDLRTDLFQAERAISRVEENGDAEALDTVAKIVGLGRNDRFHFADIPDGGWDTEQEGHFVSTVRDVLDPKPPSVFDMPPSIYDMRWHERDSSGNLVEMKPPGSHLDPISLRDQLQFFKDQHSWIVENRTEPTFGAVPSADDRQWYAATVRHFERAIAELPDGWDWRGSTGPDPDRPKPPTRELGYSSSRGRGLGDDRIINTSGSSSISRLRYDADREELVVTYSNDKTYIYGGIDAATADIIESAPSVGKAINGFKNRSRYVIKPDRTIDGTPPTLSDNLSRTTRRLLSTRGLDRTEQPLLQRIQAVLDNVPPEDRHWVGPEERRGLIRDLYDLANDLDNDGEPAAAEVIRDAAAASRNDPGQRITGHHSGRTEVTLSDDELGDISDGLASTREAYDGHPVIERGLALYADKLRGAREGTKKGKISLDTAEYNTILGAYNRLQVLDPDGYFKPGRNVLERAAYSKKGKWVSPNVAKAQRLPDRDNGFASSRLPNRGAPDGMSVRDQDDFIWWARQQTNFRVVQRLVDKFDRNGEEMEAADWIRLHDYFVSHSGRGQGMSPWGEGGRQERRPFKPRTTGTPKTPDEPEDDGQDRLPGFTSERNVAPGGPDPGKGGRPVGSGEAKKFVGLRWDDVRPDNWDELTLDEQDDWLTVNFSETRELEASERLREVDIDRIRKIIDDKRIEREERADPNLRRRRRRERTAELREERRKAREQADAGKIRRSPLLDRRDEPTGRDKPDVPGEEVDEPDVPGEEVDERSRAKQEATRRKKILNALEIQLRVRGDEITQATEDDRADGYHAFFWEAIQDMVTASREEHNDLTFDLIEKLEERVDGYLLDIGDSELTDDENASVTFANNLRDQLTEMREQYRDNKYIKRADDEDGDPDLEDVVEDWVGTDLPPEDPDDPDEPSGYASARSRAVGEDVRRGLASRREDRGFASAREVRDWPDDPLLGPSGEFDLFRHMPEQGPGDAIHDLFQSITDEELRVLRTDRALLLALDAWGDRAEAIMNFRRRRESDETHLGIHGQGPPSPLSEEEMEFLYVRLRAAQAAISQLEEEHPTRLFTAQVSIADELDRVAQEVSGMLSYEHAENLRLLSEAEGTITFEGQQYELGVMPYLRDRITDQAISEWINENLTDDETRMLAGLHTEGLGYEEGAEDIMRRMVGDRGVEEMEEDQLTRLEDLARRKMVAAETDAALTARFGDDQQQMERFGSLLDGPFMADRYPEVVRVSSEEARRIQTAVDEAWEAHVDISRLDGPQLVDLLAALRGDEDQRQRTYWPGVEPGRRRELTLRNLLGATASSAVLEDADDEPWRAGTIEASRLIQLKVIGEIGERRRLANPREQRDRSGDTVFDLHPDGTMTIGNEAEGDDYVGPTSATIEPQGDMGVEVSEADRAAADARFEQELRDHRWRVEGDDPNEPAEQRYGESEIRRMLREAGPQGERMESDYTEGGGDEPSTSGVVVHRYRPADREGVEQRLINARQAYRDSVSGRELSANEQAMQASIDRPADYGVDEFIETVFFGENFDPEGERLVELYDVDSLSLAEGLRRHRGDIPVARREDLVRRIHSASENGSLDGWDGEMETLPDFLSGFEHLPIGPDRPGLRDRDSVRWGSGSDSERLTTASAWTDEAARDLTHHQSMLDSNRSMLRMAENPVSGDPDEDRIAELRLAVDEHEAGVATATLALARESRADNARWLAHRLNEATSGSPTDEEVAAIIGWSEELDRLNVEAIAQDYAITRGRNPVPESDGTTDNPLPNPAHHRARLVMDLAEGSWPINNPEALERLERRLQALRTAIESARRSRDPRQGIADDVRHRFLARIDNRLAQIRNRLNDPPLIGQGAENLLGNWPGGGPVLVGDMDDADLRSHLDRLSDDDLEALSLEMTFAGAGGVQQLADGTFQPIPATSPLEATIREQERRRILGSAVVDQMTDDDTTRLRQLTLHARDERQALPQPEDRPSPAERAAAQAAERRAEMVTLIQAGNELTAAEESGDEERITRAREIVRALEVADQLRLQANAIFGEPDPEADARYLAYDEREEAELIDAVTGPDGRLISREGTPGIMFPTTAGPSTGMHDVLPVGSVDHRAGEIEEFEVLADLGGFNYLVQRLSSGSLHRTGVHLAIFTTGAAREGAPEAFATADRGHSPSYHFPPHSRVGTLEEVLDGLTTAGGHDRLRELISDQAWAALQEARESADMDEIPDYSTPEGRATVRFRLREGVSRDPDRQHPALRNRTLGRSRTGGPLGVGATRGGTERDRERDRVAAEGIREQTRSGLVSRNLEQLRLAEQEYDAMRLGERPLLGELPIPDRGPDPNLSDREYLDSLEGREPSEPLAPEVLREIRNTPHSGLYDDRNSYAESNFNFPQVARTDEELHDRAMEDREFQDTPQDDESIASDAAIDEAITAAAEDIAQWDREDEERRERRSQPERRRTDPPAEDGPPSGYTSERQRSDDPLEVEGRSDFKAKSSFFRIIYDPLGKEIANADNNAARNALKKLKESFEKDSKRSFRYGPRHPRQSDAGILKIDDDDLFDIIDALAEVLGKWARSADGDETTRKQALLDYLKAVEASGGARQSGDSSTEFMLPIRIAAVTKLIDMLTQRAVDLL